MRVGYACLTVSVAETNFRQLRKQNVNEKKLKEIIAHNLKSLDKIIDYNVANNIKLFRITSNLIPFGSSLANNYPWEKWFAKEFKKIAKKIKENKLRVSMHPGQYTVLNSPKKEVVENAVADLIYHEKVLTLLETNVSNKIVLHIGGVYGNKTAAIDRFIENYDKLPLPIQKRLVIENDDKSFNIIDVLSISYKRDIPVVFDNLHHVVNHCDLNLQEIFKKTRKTWKKEDGIPKIHYSEQAKEKTAGAHSLAIDVEKFGRFIKKIPFDVDIMLEVKDKNKSAIKCNNLVVEK